MVFFGKTCSLLKQLTLFFCHTCKYTRESVGCEMKGVRPNQRTCTMKKTDRFWQKVLGICTLAIITSAFLTISFRYGGERHGEFVLAATTSNGQFVEPGSAHYVMHYLGEVVLPSVLTGAALTIGGMFVLLLCLLLLALAFQPLIAPKHERP